MFLYIPTSNSDVCERLSVALWQLSRPLQTTTENDVIRRLFRSITCTNNSVWLLVDTSFDINIHSDAVLGDIITILQPWIDAGALANDVLTQLQSTIETFKINGERMNIWNAFPEFFKQQSKTFQEMIDNGLLVIPQF